MNASSRMIACGTAALFAAALSLQAQSSQQRQSQQSSQPTNPPSLQGQQATNEQPQDKEQPASQERRNEQWRSQQPGRPDRPSQPEFDPKSTPKPDVNRTDRQSDVRNQRSGSQTQYQTQHQTTVTAETDTQVTTVVQQIDSQGPVVVERVSTQFADVACTPDNARMIFESLHSGNEVTLNIEGKTATFRPTGRLGYGEAYIALALAAEALRNAGINGCATPDQWRAVLLGGQLSGGTSSTTTVSTTHFPGILTLKARGQGWGQVAQTTNVQLGQVVSRANTSLNINTNIQDNASRQQQTGQQGPQQNQRESRSSQSHPAGHDQFKQPGQDQQKGYERDQASPRSDSNPGSSQRRPEGSR